MRKAAEPSLQTIDSARHPWIRELRAGLQKGTLTRRGYVALEGPHLLEEAMRSGLKIHAIFLRSGSKKWPDQIPDQILGQAHDQIEDVRRFHLPPGIFDTAADTVHSQGVAALSEPPRFRDPEFSLRRGKERAPMLVISGGLQDPGNLGTLMRSAEAFGADGMILLPGTVSAWNQKVMRASAGTVFRLPHWTMRPEAAFSLLRTNQIRTIAAMPRCGTSIFESSPGAAADLTGPAALLLGNEGAGLPEEWLKSADVQISIPLAGAAESLNAAIAGSVLLFEAARQRTMSGRTGEAPR